MASPSLKPLDPAERRARRNRAARIALELGFVGNVEYRHVYSQTGGRNMAVEARQTKTC